MGPSRPRICRSLLIGRSNVCSTPGSVFFLLRLLLLLFLFLLLLLLLLLLLRLGLALLLLREMEPSRALRDSREQETVRSEARRDGPRSESVRVSLSVS